MAAKFQKWNKLNQNARIKRAKLLPLENKRLGNGDYFVIIAASSHIPLLLKEHAENGLVEAPLK